MQGCKKIDFSKLLGFETVSDQIEEDFDFQDETIGDKLGSKIGPPEPGADVAKSR